MIPTRLFVLPIAAMLATSGCVSAKYKLAPKDAPPPLVLNLSSEPAATADGSTASLKTTLHTVIVFRGPGSWKREALWDEYVVTIANRGATPATIDSATIVDFQNQSVLAGDNPWNVERESQSYQQRLATTGLDVLTIGGGLVATTAAGLLGGVAIGTVATGAGGWAALDAAVVGGLAGTLVAAPVFVGATIYRNVTHRHNVETEFQTRRLSLPVTVLPGQSVQGSLFFRICPGPQRITFDGHSGVESVQVKINLARLAGLHLKSETTPIAKADPLAFPQ